MYTPSHFDEPRLPVLQEFMARHPLAALVAQAADGLVANHIPVILDASRGEFGTLRGHLARANGMWRMVAAGSEVLAIFNGVSHYISPGWYPSKQEDSRVVPTWNYAAVHAHGKIEWFHDPAWLRDLLETTTNFFESDRPTPWRVADAPEEFVQRQLGAIVGFEIPILKLAGKVKLSQNRSDADRAGVIAGLGELPDGDAREMAELMAGPAPATAASSG